VADVSASLLPSIFFPRPQERSVVIYLQKEDDLICKTSLGCTRRT